MENITTHWVEDAKTLMRRKPKTSESKMRAHEYCNELIKHLRCGKRRYNLNLHFLRIKLRLWRDRLWSDHPWTD